MNTSNPVALRDSEWAMSLLGYTRESRSAFWQFVYRAGVPHIRTGTRKIQFSEQQVLDWLQRRSSAPGIDVVPGNNGGAS